MERKPRIGLSVYKTPEKDNETEITFWLNDTYVNMVAAAGGVPLLLPYSFDDWDLLDGVVICGGHDLMPGLAGYEADDPGKLAPYRAERDEFELLLLREADAHALPVLGICRGCQLVNCAYGGTLVPDIPTAGFTEEHRIKPFTKEGTHPVTVAEDSLTKALLAGRTAVCSAHHQSVKEPGRGFTVTARSPEGVVEAIEHENGRILGLQTHPERMEWLEPFTWLMEKAKAHMQKRNPGE